MAIGVGVIGTGKHGARYLRHLAETTGVRLVAMSRRDPERGARQAAELGIRFHSDPLSLIRDPEVEAVVLVVPPTLNARLAVATAEAGKAMLVEKPLAATLAECRTIAEAVARRGTAAMVAHTLRYNAVVQTLRAALPAAGALHAVLLSQRFEPSELPWIDRPPEAGGGIILHTGVHSFDLLRYLTGREAVRVQASASSVVTRETEDNFAAVVEMENAMVGVVAGSRATAGRSGHIELAARGAQLVGDHVHGIAARLVGTARESLEVGPPVHTVGATIAEFVAALTERRAPAITIADGAASVALAEACYRAMSADAPATVERL